MNTTYKVIKSRSYLKYAVCAKYLYYFYLMGNLIRNIVQDKMIIKTNLLIFKRYNSSAKNNCPCVPNLKFIQ